MTDNFNYEAWRLNPAERFNNPTPMTDALLALPADLWHSRIVDLARKLERELAVDRDRLAYWEAEARRLGSKGPNGAD
jgi:hypothetical protein